ncbi:P-loop containing nucleoside triphosphate hydrolase protein, partial [Catenaria anguillulae PL171]
MATRPEDRAVPGMLAQGSLVHRVLQHHPSATATLAPALAASPGGHSTIDILICTPGRLHDHLAHTPGFTLQHLRYLVIDEADRILNAPESDGMPVRGAGCMPGTLGARMRAAAQPIKLLFSATLTRNPEKLARVKLDEPVLLAAAAAAAPALETDSGKPVEPVSKYLVPTTLYETMAIMPSIADKPIALLHLVRHMATGVPTVGVFDPAKRHVQPWTQTTLEPVQQVATDKAWRVLVFTKSVDSARRLAKVLSHATAGEGDAKLADVHLFSRELTQAERTTLLRTFRTSSSTSSSLAQPPVRVLVASDILARGVDLPAVDVVVNYDPPAYVPQYIHRVGRTARAGATGVALTMLAAHEARFFKDMMAEKRGHAWRADKDRVKQVEVRHDVDMVREVEKVYREIAGGDDEFDVDEGNEDEEAQRGAEGQAEMGVDEENEEAVALTELIAIDTQVAAAEESKKSKKSKKEKKEKKDKKDKKSSKSKSKGSVEEDLPKVKEVLAVAPGTNGLGTAPPTSKKKQKTALPAFQGKLMVFES